MKVYVINLDRSPTRMARMTRMLDTLGIPFERMPAIDGNTLSAEATRAVIAPAAGHHPRPPEIGCFLSHRQCWQMVAEGDEDAALILEDDVVFSKNAGALLRNPNLIKSGADVIRLESVPSNVWLSTKTVPLGDGYHLCACPYGTSGAGAYIVTKKGAGKLIEQSSQYVWPVDLWLFLNEAGKPRARIVVHAINPAPCTQFLFAYPERINAAGMTSTLDHRVTAEPPPSAWSRLQTRIISRASKTWRRLRGLRKVIVNLHPTGPLPEFD